MYNNKVTNLHINYMLYSFKVAVGEWKGFHRKIFTATNKRNIIEIFSLDYNLKQDKIFFL